MKLSPSSSRGLALLLAVLSLSATAQAETEVLLPLEDTYVIGGSRSQSTPAGSGGLIVAARGEQTLDLVRKIFLLFETPSGDATVENASLSLTFAGEGVRAQDGDPRPPVQLRLYAAPAGDWSEQELSWDSAPFHDPRSISDEANPELELLAEMTIDSSKVKEDDVLTVSTPQLTEFVRKNRGRLTFVVTSLGSPQSPGLVFFDSSQTGLQERKPRLVLELK